MKKKTLNQRRNKEKNRMIVGIDLATGPDFSVVKGWKQKPLIITDDTGEVIDLKPTPKLIKTWAELKECTSETHILDIDVEGGNGWIQKKKDPHHYCSKKCDCVVDQYLSTHTFYSGTHKHSTDLLQSCGFNVEIANWDELGW